VATCDAVFERWPAARVAEPGICGARAQHAVAP